MKATKEDFIKEVEAGYTFKGDSIVLGASMFGEDVIPTHVKIPLKTFNRHGLISGATGTGKTKSLQILAEQLSQKGVPVLLMDMKGDLSGLAQPGEEKEFITKRHTKIGFKYEAQESPVELLSLSNEKGVKLRATVTEFGPVLFSKILELNDVQSSIITVLFKYSDDQKLPLIDLEDLRKMLQYAIGEGKTKIEDEYGAISSASVNTILRKILELEQQGADTFFGEPSFEVNDLLQNRYGRGVVSILRLTDIQDKPKLFSTFMLSLLAEVYNTFPEQGDQEKPELVIFIDEAHLIFDNASNALLDQLEAIIKLIRSKGVGIFFCTQLPTDVPEEILSQLGLKIQHALRAFTAKDRKSIKLVSENFPITNYYNTEQVLTSLGIGEALVTALNEKGIPTPLVATYMRAPMSRMDILSRNEIDELVNQSKLIEKYNQKINRESAEEILKKKIEEAQKDENQKILQEERAKAEKTLKKRKSEPSFTEELSKNTMVRQLGRTVMREVTRGILGALGIKSSSKRKSIF